MSETTSGVTTEQIADMQSTAPSGEGPAAREPAPATATVEPDDEPRLIEDSGRFLQRWKEIQATFVDEPRQAVEQADSLVAEVIQELARAFANERSKLEARWSGGGEVDTEELRLTLQRYRDFFHVLLRD